MAKYRVGDRVLIRGDLSREKRYYMENSLGSNYAVGNMILLAGTIATISKKDYQYRIEEDGGVWNWTDEMFEGLVSECLADVSDLI